MSMLIERILQLDEASTTSTRANMIRISDNKTTLEFYNGGDTMTVQSPNEIFNFKTRDVRAEFGWKNAYKDWNSNPYIKGSNGAEFSVQVHDIDKITVFVGDNKQHKYFVKLDLKCFIELISHIANATIKAADVRKEFADLD